MKYRYFVIRGSMLRKDAAAEIEEQFSNCGIMYTRIGARDLEHVGYKIWNIVPHTEWVSESLVAKYRFSEIFMSSEDHREWHDKRQKDMGLS